MNCLTVDQNGVRPYIMTEGNAVTLGNTCRGGFIKKVNLKDVPPKNVVDGKLLRASVADQIIYGPGVKQHEDGEVLAHINTRLHGYGEDGTVTVIWGRAFCVASGHGADKRGTTWHDGLWLLCKGAGLRISPTAERPTVYFLFWDGTTLRRCASSQELLNAYILPHLRTQDPKETRALLARLRFEGSQLAATAERTLAAEY